MLAMLSSNFVGAIPNPGGTEPEVPEADPCWKRACSAEKIECPGKMVSVSFLYSLPTPDNSLFLLLVNILAVLLTHMSTSLVSKEYWYKGTYLLLTTPVPKSRRKLSLILSS